MSAHTASQIVGVVTILVADQPTAVTVALAVVSDPLKRPIASSTRDQIAVADMVRRLVEPGAPVVLDAARAAP